MSNPDEAIDRLAGTRLLLVALDFDGTLAPLGDDPMAVRMAPEARAAIEALTRTPDTVVALVSGRSLQDLRVIAEHADDSPVLLAGSHGAEFWTGDDIPEREDVATVALRDDLRGRAEALVADLDGAWIEAKQYGFAVHTRLASAETAEAADATVDALMRDEAPEWRRRTGHHVVEFSSRDEGKDTAVRALRELTRATAVLFAGDDVTDEDALGSLGADDVGVLVGDRETYASVMVPDIPAMAALLARLAEERGRRRR